MRKRHLAQYTLLIAAITLIIGPPKNCAAHEQTPSGTETPAYHKEFKHVKQWVKKFDDPERDVWQKPDEVIANLHVQPKDVVADIGAGTGYFSIRIAQAVPGAKVLAGDIETDMIDYLAAQAKERHLDNLVPVKLDPAKPALPEKANLVLIVDTLHHIDNRDAYLKELCSYLDNKNRIAIIDFTKDSPTGPPAKHRIPIEEVSAEMKSIGFELEQEFKFLPHQYFLIYRRTN